MNSTISRYADAFLAACSSLPPAEIEALFTAGERLGDLLENEEELRRFFLSPFFSLSEKKTVFAEIADRCALGTPLRNLFLTLLESRHPLLFGAVLHEAQRLYWAAQGIVEVEVRTAVPLDEGTISGLRPVLEKQFGKHLAVTHVVDPALLGGIMIRHGNTIYDASLRNYLHLLADSLKKGELSHARESIS